MNRDRRPSIAGKRRQKRKTDYMLQALSPPRSKVVCSSTSIDDDRRCSRGSPRAKKPDDFRFERPGVGWLYQNYRREAVVRQILPRLKAATKDRGCRISLEQIRAMRRIVRLTQAVPRRKLFACAPGA